MDEKINQPEKEEQPNQEELNAWIKKQLDAAVQKAMKQGRMEGLLVEAKPAWVLPFQVLIGMIREQGKTNSFDWCICGEVPTDFLQPGVANTPREALRHFAMKWQLAAARHNEVNLKNPTQDNPELKLATQAEDIYDLVEDDRLWMQN